MEATADLISRFLKLTLAVALSLATLIARDKTDVIVLENGDRVTGEIKKLERGLLRVKTDFMGTVSIEWEHIKSVQSQYFFEVELDSGQKHFGSLETEEETVSVLDTEASHEASHMSVVTITPIEGSFLERIDVSVDFGFSFTRANRSKQLNLGTNTSYRSEDHLVLADFHSLFDSQKESEASTRNVLGLQYHRFLGNRWFAAALSEFTQNEELALDLRSVVGGGAGRRLIHTSTAILSVLGGAVINRERFAGEPVQTGVEGLGGFRLQTFRFDNPELDLTTSFYAIPSLSDAGRVRLEFDTKLRIEIVNDLYWSANLFDSYDSRPPEGIEGNDFGIITSVGYSF